MFWVSKRLEPPRISGSIIKICYPSVNMSSVRCDFPHDYIIDDFPVFSWGFSMLSMGFPRVSPGFSPEKSQTFRGSFHTSRTQELTREHSMKMAALWAGWLVDGVAIEEAETYAIIIHNI